MPEAAGKRQKHDETVVECGRRPAVESTCCRVWGEGGRVCLSSASSLFPFAHLLACEAFIVRDTPDAKERI